MIRVSDWRASQLFFQATNQIKQKYKLLLPPEGRKHFHLPHRSAPRGNKLKLIPNPKQTEKSFREQSRGRSNLKKARLWHETYGKVERWKIAILGLALFSLYLPNRHSRVRWWKSIIQMHTATVPEDLSADILARLHVHTHSHRHAF